MSNSIEVKYATGHVDYDNAVDKFYCRLISELHFSLISSSAPLVEATGRLEMWHYLLRPDSPEDEIGQAVKAIFKADVVDSRLARVYADQILQGEEEPMLSDSTIDSTSMALGKALIFYLQELSKIIDLIDNGGDIRGIVQGLSRDSKLFEVYYQNIKKYQDTYYGWLKATFDTRQIAATRISKISTVDEFVKFELDQFNELFSVGGTHHDWTTLLNRLDCKDAEEINALHAVALEMQGGDFVEYITMFKSEKQILAGKVLAIRDFIKYLKTLLNKEIPKPSVSGTYFYFELLPKYNKEKYKERLFLELTSGPDPLIDAKKSKVEDSSEKGMKQRKLYEATYQKFLSLFEPKSDTDFKITWIGGRNQLLFFVLLLTDKKNALTNPARNVFFDNADFLDSNFRFRKGNKPFANSFAVLKSHQNSYLNGSRVKNPQRDLPALKKMLMVADVLIRVFDVDIILPPIHA
jgi:hypothetical protein